MLLSSKDGKASRWTRARKMASMTIVVRRHFLSRPLRRIVASMGKSMRQVKWELRMRGPAAQIAHSRPTVCKKSSGKAVAVVDLAKTCFVKHLGQMKWPEIAPPTAMPVCCPVLVWIDVMLREGLNNGALITGCDIGLHSSRSW